MTKKSKPDDTISDADYYRANGIVGMGLENISPKDLEEAKEEMETESITIADQIRDIEIEEFLSLGRVMRLRKAREEALEGAAAILARHGHPNKYGKLFTFVEIAILEENRKQTYKNKNKENTLNITKKEALKAFAKTSKAARELEAAASEAFDVLLHCSWPEGVDTRTTNDFHENIFALSKHQMLVKIESQAKEIHDAYEKEIGGTYLHKQAVKKDFIERCTELWLDCGLEVKTTIGGEFDEYICLAYIAAFGKEVANPSRILTIAKTFADKDIQKGITLKTSIPRQPRT